MTNAAVPALDRANANSYPGAMTSRAFIAGCLGTSLTPDERAFFRDARPWGFILFRRNTQSPEQVATWLRAADVFALSTFDEGCCNAVLEAMACGLPVITTPVGDNARLVDPPHRGFIVPVNDAEALASALSAALATDWDRETISQFESHYTWDEAARMTSDFFRSRLAALR